MITNHGHKLPHALHSYKGLVALADVFCVKTCWQKTGLDWTGLTDCLVQWNTVLVCFLFLLLVKWIQGKHN